MSCGSAEKILSALCPITIALAPMQASLLPVKQNPETKEFEEVVSCVCRQLLRTGIVTFVVMSRMCSRRSNSLRQIVRRFKKIGFVGCPELAQN
jgi:hypothetical protein